MRRSILAGLIIMIICLMIAPSALAAKGGIKGSPKAPAAGAITISGDLTFGSYLYVSQTVMPDPLELGQGPWIWNQCYINGVLVLSDVRADFPGGYGYGVPFMLGPTARWSGGAADCRIDVGGVDMQHGGSTYVVASLDYQTT